MAGGSASHPLVECVFVRVYWKSVNEGAIRAATRLKIVPLATR
jgi:hypothetical protein